MIRIIGLAIQEGNGIQIASAPRISGCRSRLRRKEVIDLRTYQNLQAAGQDEKALISFIEDVIREHKASSSYQK